MFLNDDYLLKSQTGKRLYHNYMKKLPIYDYHCHIDPKEIADNKSFSDITEVWLGGDHYKWRIMRANGVAEATITGKDTHGFDKFQAWCETLPLAIGNPLYHWSHLELRKYFNIELLINTENAKVIWEKTKEDLKKESHHVRGLIEQSHVTLICTTDDPVDSLEHHVAISKDDTFKTDVLPAFRPDKSFNVANSGFSQWFSKLQAITPFSISNFNAYKEALALRVTYFHEHGCRLSDHALDPIECVLLSDEQLEAVFQKALAGDAISSQELAGFRTAMMMFYAHHYTQLDWVMQLHIGTMRGINSKMQHALGADTGFDAIGDWPLASALAAFMDAIHQAGDMPKVVLYTLNPRDNVLLGTIMNCFQGEGVKGKIQFGSAWWFNDHISGMEKQMTDLANLGLLGNFIGMTTDSRSFLSYTRHDYFRRIVANLIGSWVDEGLYPNDESMLKTIVQNIAYYNAVRYFNMGNVDRQLNHESV